VKEKEEKKAIHNYILLVILFAATAGLVIYLCKWYNVYHEYQKETPVIRGSIMEIVNDDLEHYILDNPTAVIYMCTAKDDACRSFEKDFKKLLKKRDYNNEIIYLNLSDLNQDEFVESFNNKYNYKIKLTTHYPAFVLFEDGKVVNVLQGSNKKPLTISKVKQFLELNEIGEE
jgi:predicted bacteriocin transport accessory protein